MFTFTETFSLQNETGAPYGFYDAPTHCYTTPSAKIGAHGYMLMRRRARQIAKIPPLSDFFISATIGRNAPQVKSVLEFTYGYNESTLSGHMVSIQYNSDAKTLLIEHVSMTGARRTVTDSVSYSDAEFLVDTPYPFTLEKKGHLCTGSVSGYTYAFETDAVCGRLAVSSAGNAGTVFLRDFSVTSPDGLLTEPVYTHSFEIPHYDGGSEPYVLRLTVERCENPAYALPNSIYKIEYTLTGGAFSRPETDYGMHVWSVQYDILENAYIRFLGDTISEKLFLKNGALVFIEKNPKGNYAEAFMGGEKMPYGGSFFVSQFDATQSVSFGYDWFRRLGNEFQSDRSEFVFASPLSPEKGALLYYGRPVSDAYHIRVTSPKDKKITACIPKTVTEYEKALMHAAENHYFFVDEKATFTLHVDAEKADFVSYQLSLTDAYFEEIRPLDFQIAEDDESIFKKLGRSSKILTATIADLPQGVYHLRADVFYGEKRVIRHFSAFEVIDPESELSPRQSAGLPFLYSGEAAPPNIRYNCPDPWLIKPDFNILHYMDCLLCQPEISEERRVWELLDLYKLSLFAWMDDRTTPHRDYPRHYPGTLQNADYLTFMPSVTKGGPYVTNPYYFQPEIQEIYSDFKKLHPEFADALPQIDAENAADVEKLRTLYTNFRDIWLTYLNRRISEAQIAANDAVRASNKKVKFARYGALGYYATNHVNAYWGKWRSVDLATAHRMFDGFAIYEDYCFIVGKQPYNCAWGLMGYMLYTPEMEILPEFFSNFDPVCPDGAVFHANPPMGDCRVPAYQVATQLYDYMFASAVFENGKYRYYKNHKFQLLQSYNTDAKGRFRAFLKGWGAYLKNKPKKPLGAPAFISSFTPQEDIYDYDLGPLKVNNRSLAGITYLYQSMSDAGLPRGYITDWDGLLDLSPAETSLVVLPSLSAAPEAVIRHIRALHAQNVALVAVGDVCGLEDLFGVLPNKRTVTARALFTETESEYISIQEDTLYYDADKAEVLLWADCTDEKHPIVLRHGRCVLLNAYVEHIGVESAMYGVLDVGNASRLLKAVCKAAVKSVFAPIATATDKSGITLFENEKGETLILLTDYTPYGTPHGKEITVRFDKAADALSGTAIVPLGCEEDAESVNPLYKDGKLCGFSVYLREREARLFKILK